MDWISTHHAIKQINERNIPADIILKTLKSPDEILPNINYPQPVWSIKEYLEENL